MAITPWLTSVKLLAAIKRKISFPSHQATFTDDELLAFSNEEMMISQVPSVLSFHEEYYVTSKLVPLENNKTRYSIPDRAIGMKLRDVFFVSTNGDYSEMTRVSSEDKAFFQANTGVNDIAYTYYLEGNDLVLTTNMTSAPSGASILFNYFIRPNQLVTDDRAAISSAFTKSITLNNSNIVAGNTVTIGSVVFTAVAGAPGTNQFQIGASSAATAVNLTASISTNGTYSSSVLSNVVSIDYDLLSTEITTSNALGFSIQTTQGIKFVSVPSNITNSSYVDFLQTKPGHKILGIDVKLSSNSVSSNIITFNSSDIPTNFLVGDYVCLQNECIIPYLPTDLHTGLAERTCARILSALGDTAGLADVNAKIAEIEVRQGTILTNRVEGSPKKINGRNSILRYTKFRNRGF